MLALKKMFFTDQSTATKRKLGHKFLLRVFFCITTNPGNVIPKTPKNVKEERDYKLFSKVKNVRES